MKIVNFKMFSVNSNGRSNKTWQCHLQRWNFVSVLLTLSLFYLSSMVSADHFDWKNNVPKMTYVPIPAPVYTGKSLQSRQPHYPYYQHNKYNNHNLHHQQYQPFTNSGIVSAKAFPQSGSFYSTLTKTPPLDASSSSTAPRAFFGDSSSSSSSLSSSLLPVASSSVQTLVASPRSLTNAPSPAFIHTTSPHPAKNNNSSSSATTTTTVAPTTTTTTLAPVKSSDKKMKTKKKRKKQKQRRAGKTIDTETSATNNALMTALADPSNTELDVGTGRTFFLTPLLAYLFPVFLAQMFGMGMIPAAALITLPIFLLPLGLMAAVFLI